MDRYEITSTERGARTTVRSLTLASSKSSRTARVADRSRSGMIRLRGSTTHLSGFSAMYLHAHKRVRIIPACYSPYSDRL